MNFGKNRYLRKGIIIAGWLLIWQAASLYMGNRILLVGPGETLLALLDDIRSAAFWQAVGTSSLRILSGFFAAFICGLFLGALTVRFPLAGEILAPVFSLIKSVPVASVVILLLIWTSSRYLSTAVSFMIVLPTVYFSARAGIASADIRLLEMARVFRIRPGKKLWYIYRPAVMPYLISSCRTALGMSWKSGVAAEVIGVPDHTIGERLYMAKIYLETGELFAWTLVILGVSLASERLFLQLLGRLSGSRRGGG